MEGVPKLKNQGRIVLLFLSLLTSFIFWIIGDDFSLPIFIAFTLFHATGAWFFGGFYDKVKYQSNIDPLTGAFNRRYANNNFEKKLHQAKKRNGKIGIIMIDIDQFKLMNDTYGHDYGDFILKKLSHLIEKRIHREDIFVRWGGDEFLLLIDRDNMNTELFVEVLNERAEKILNERQKENENFPSVSIGYSMFPEDAVKLSELISIADERMYHGKREMKFKKIR